MMGFSSTPVGQVIATAFVIAIAGSVEASAQVADLSGAWKFTVTTDTGTTYPVVTLEHEGATLTGRYSSDALGESALSGRVRGWEVTLIFLADVEDQLYPVTYTGRVNKEGTIFGTVDIAAGFVTATFTAVRSDR